MVTTQTADKVLKSYYLDVVGETLNKSANPFLAEIKKTTSDVWGRDVRKTVRIGLSGGVGAGSETGALPAAQSPNYAQLVGTLKNLYGTIEISDKAIRASQNNEGAFVNLLNDEMENLVKSASFNLGRMLFNDAKGTLATVKSAGSAPVFDTIQCLFEGMVVDVYGANSDTPKKTGVVIQKVDRDNSTLTLSEEVTFSVGDILVLQNSYGLELTGLRSIFAATGTLYGLDKASNPWLVPTRLTSTSINEAILQKAIDNMETGYGSKINLIVCSLGVRRNILKEISSTRRFEPERYVAGLSTITFNGVPIVADKFCPAGTVYLLNTDDFALHQLCDWQWLEGEDGKVLKQIPGKPVYTATLVKYAELMCYRPCGQAMITGITES